MDQVVVGDRLERFPRLTPGRKATHNNECIEPFFPQQVRHTGAGSFPCSSAIDVNILVPGESFQFFGQVIRLDTN